MGHFGRPYPTHQFWHIACGTFQQPLIKGSWAGLVTLNAYMAATLVIEEYLIEKITNLKTKFYCKKLCKTRVHLLIGHKGHTETLLRSPRRRSVKPCMAGQAPPFLTAHSTGVDCIFTLVVPCETFAKSSDDQLHSAYPTLLRYHRALCLLRQDDRIRRISQTNTFHFHVLNCARLGNYQLVHSKRGDFLD